MANTSKSTRKKPASASKASKAVKTAKAAKTKKPIIKTKNTDIKYVKAVLTPYQRVRSLHFSLALMYAVFAGLVIGFVSAASSAVTLGIQTRDNFASDTNVILGPAREVLYSVQPKYVLAASLLVGAIGSLLLASKLRNRYESTLTARISGLRWVILGLSAALTLEFINLLAGVHDVTLLKLSGALIFITTMLAWVSERDNAAAGKSKWLAYDLSLLTGVLAWLPVAGSLIGTSLYGMERFGWHVYALVAVTLVGFTAFALNQYLYTRAKGARRDYVAIEESYLRIDMLTKFAVVLIVLLALK